MNCGHVYDSIIRQNRQVKPEPALIPAGEPDYQDDEVHLGRESYLARVA
jgi:hypothetical protein